MKGFRLCLIALILLSACSEGRNENEKESPEQPKPVVRKENDTLPRGKVLTQVPYRSNGNESFAIYLPTALDSMETVPVLYCLDPQGNGQVPVQLYHELAEEYGFILVGGNTVKNGMNFPETDAALTRLIADIQGRFRTEDRVRLLGFSGGAKVAVHYADVNARVTQVIYIGGVYALNRTDGPALLGFAGIRDMNYADLVSFETSLGKRAMPHYLVEWEGPHEFPNPGVLRDGFDFLVTDSVSGYESKRVKVSQEEMMREQLLKRKFYQSFGNKDLKWWEQEILALHAMKKDDVMFERVLGFIGLACYSYAGQAIEANDLARAEYIVRIYELATPQNEDVKKFRQAVEQMRHD